MSPEKLRNKAIHVKNPSFTVNQKQSFLSAETELMYENLYSNKITFTVKKTAARPAAALPFTAADRNRNRTAQNFFEILLAIGQSGSAALPLPRVPPFLCIHFSCVRPVTMVLFK